MSIFVLMAGGTGGHLFPAMALAQELRRRGHVIHLMTDHRVAGYGDNFPARETHIVPSATPSIRNPVKFVGAALKILLGHRRRLAASSAAVQADAVVGFGGYPTVPPFLAARLRGVPGILHEQNAVIGRANRALAPLREHARAELRARRAHAEGFEGKVGAHRQSGARSRARRRRIRRIRRSATTVRSVSSSSAAARARASSANVVPPAIALLPRSCCACVCASCSSAGPRTSTASPRPIGRPRSTSSCSRSSPTCRSAWPTPSGHRPLRRVAPSPNSRASAGRRSSCRCRARSTRTRRTTRWSSMRAGGGLDHGAGHAFATFARHSLDRAVRAIRQRLQSGRGRRQVARAAARRSRRWPISPKGSCRGKTDNEDAAQYRPGAFRRHRRHRHERHRRNPAQPGLQGARLRQRRQRQRAAPARPWASTSRSASRRTTSGTRRSSSSRRRSRRAIRSWRRRGRAACRWCVAPRCWPRSCASRTPLQSPARMARPRRRRWSRRCSTRPTTTRRSSMAASSTPMAPMRGSAAASGWWSRPTRATAPSSSCRPTW